MIGTLPDIGSGTFMFGWPSGAWNIGGMPGPSGYPYAFWLCGGGKRFCAGCGAGMQKFCFKCHKKVEMIFEEWWPEEDECQRTYTTPRRCTHCNAVLETGPEGREAAGGEDPRSS